MHCLGVNVAGREDGSWFCPKRPQRSAFRPKQLMPPLNCLLRCSADCWLQRPSSIGGGNDSRQAPPTNPDLSWIYLFASHTQELTSMEALSNSRENTGLNGSQVHRFWKKKCQTGKLNTASGRSRCCRRWASDTAKTTEVSRSLANERRFGPHQIKADSSRTSFGR